MHRVCILVIFFAFTKLFLGTCFKLIENYANIYNGENRNSYALTEPHNNYFDDVFMMTV